MVGFRRDWHAGDGEDDGVDDGPGVEGAGGGDTCGGEDSGVFVDEDRDGQHQQRWRGAEIFDALMLKKRRSELWESERVETRWRRLPCNLLKFTRVPIAISKISLIRSYSTAFFWLLLISERRGCLPSPFTWKIDLTYLKWSLFICLPNSNFILAYKPKSL